MIGYRLNSAGSEMQALSYYIIKTLQSYHGPFAAVFDQIFIIEYAKYESDVQTPPFYCINCFLFSGRPFNFMFIIVS